MLTSKNQVFPLMQFIALIGLPERSAVPFGAAESPGLSQLKEGPWTGPLRGDQLPRASNPRFRFARTIDFWANRPS